MKKSYNIKIKSLLLCIAITISSCSFFKSKTKNAQTVAEMEASKSQAIEDFNDAKYGMFIHWGLYAIPGGVWKGKKIEDYGRPPVAEWIQCTAQIPRDEYAALAPQFNPEDFDADAIAKLAKDAGMKYLVITSKHHDGFAMYHSKVSDYNIVDATPFKRDVVQELYDACKKYGIDFGLYYSHNIDWMDGNDCGYADLAASGREMNAKAKRKMGANTWDPSSNSFQSYLTNKAFPQVKEILTQFPDLKTLWYDMPHYLSPKQSADFYKLAYELQPNMLVNSRVGNDMGDFDIPGDNKIPKDHLAITKPWQTVGTTNNSWGYKSYDHDWKSVKELLFWLTEIVSKGGNYMLNIGPNASGEVPQESIDNLRAVGNWLAINGEAIYNTRKWKVTHEGPTVLEMNGTHDRAQKKDKTISFTPQDFWFTQKENTLYAIALEYPTTKISIKSFGSTSVGTIKSVQMLGVTDQLEWPQTDEGLQVHLAKNRGNSHGYALKIGF